MCFYRPCLLWSQAIKFVLLNEKKQQFSKLNGHLLWWQRTTKANIWGQEIKTKCCGKTCGLSNCSEMTARLKLNSIPGRMFLKYVSLPPPFPQNKFFVYQPVWFPGWTPVQTRTQVVNGLGGFIARAAGNGDGKECDEVAEAEGRRGRGWRATRLAGSCRWLLAAALRSHVRPGRCAKPMPRQPQTERRRSTYVCGHLPLRPFHVF